MPPATDLLNLDLLQRIPLSARTVLDVGCGAGGFLRAYRRANPKARLLGIDRDPEAAAQAARHMDQVAALDVETQALPFDVPQGIDCIIYLAVLEHLRDPWAVLRRHAGALAPDGMMLICTSNVEHWSLIERLLRGTWDYEDAGLLDRSHLRWFSLETIRKGIEELGLSLCDIQPRVFANEAGQAFAKAMEPTLFNLGISPDAWWQRAAPLQFVFRARKTPQERMLIAATMLDPIGGVSHVRVVYPLQAMMSDPMISTMLTTSGEMPDFAAGMPRVLILHRPALTGPAGLAAMRRLADAGWLLVIEFDDHPSAFQAMQQDENWTFRAAHAVQTSTPALAEVMRQHNPEVAVFPNAILSLPEIRNFSDPNSVTLFFGALNRERAWAPLMPALNAVAHKAGDRLKFQVMHDRAFFDALETPHKAFTPTSEHDAYLDLLSRCEISFMPLADDWFDRAKSDLKFIEAGACRVASLASTIVYSDSIVDGSTGLLFKDADELATRLLRLVAMPDVARQIGDAARRYVAQERMMAYQVAQRIAWYRSLWARRDELRAAWEERVTQARTMQPEAAPG
jgi:SAM-dependent methyltransferase